MNPIDHLSSQIKNSASIIQFAKDGKYEEAWIISLDQQHPSSHEIESYLQQGEYKELIVEYIWNPDDDAHRHVLTVAQNKECKEQDGKAFISTCFDLFYQKLSFEQLVSQLDQRIIGHPFLLQHPVERIRLGVFNHWFSVGPVELWSEGEKIQKELIEKKIMQRPEVFRSKLNFQGLAFIYNFNRTLSGPFHVLKTPVCKKEGDEWVVDLELVNKNIKILVSK